MRRDATIRIGCAAPLHCGDNSDRTFAFVTFLSGTYGLTLMAHSYPRHGYGAILYHAIHSELTGPRIHETRTAIPVPQEQADLFGYRSPRPLGPPWSVEEQIEKQTAFLVTKKTNALHPTFTIVSSRNVEAALVTLEMVNTLCPLTNCVRWIGYPLPLNSHGDFLFVGGWYDKRRFCQLFLAKMGPPVGIQTLEMGESLTGVCQPISIVTVAPGVNALFYTQFTDGTHVNLWRTIDPDGKVGPTQTVLGNGLTINDVATWGDRIYAFASTRNGQTYLTNVEYEPSE